MSFTVKVTGHVKSVVDAELPGLTGSLIASGITAGDPSLWGPAAEEEAARRLGWVRAVSVSRPLVAEITALRDQLVAQGVTRVVLAGMGGSSLAPEVIAQSSGVPLVILDSTAPAQVLAAIDGDAESGGLDKTALVVSSKSGSTIETDSAKRAFEAAFRDLGIDPAERIVVVTDPGSPLEESARADGYRVFTADPTVGGRYSALTAFGLVPSGLAGVDIGDLLDEADATLLEVAIDSPENPALVLAAAIAGGGDARRDKLALVTDDSHILGLPDWIEQLIAESTGKDGTGILSRSSCFRSPPSSRRNPPTSRSCVSSTTLTNCTSSSTTTARSSSADRSGRSSSCGSTPPPSRDACSASTRSISPTSSPRSRPPAVCSTRDPNPRPRRSSPAASKYASPTRPWPPVARSPACSTRCGAPCRPTATSASRRT
ncbi:hypothetical protein QE412_000971 [Microbacterium trichothecenolyticum]|uniref:Glucose-6-phosphate isomerase n=1 Tax=Microbacterium trichothecenolyticum TaxID=69370 RepID=A0ABU0TRX2_MICTR|nr:hypothetical protein [Microbacterium trichothecenolyticum]